jgi:hypothetical protein
MEPVMDVTGCLRLTEKDRLAALVDDFEHRFPQLCLSLFIGVLPEMKVLEAGFWLLNHGVRKRQNQVCDNRFGIVALVDPVAHEAGISIGYSLESMLGEDVLAVLLRKNSHHLWHADYFAAFKGLIHGLDAALRRVGLPQPRALPSKSAGHGLGLRGATASQPLFKTTTPMDR